MAPFLDPSFESGDLELRFADGEVMIYGTPSGLERFASLCVTLAQGTQATEHRHIEDYELLTPQSLRGVIAVFRQLGTVEGAGNGDRSN